MLAPSAGKPTVNAEIVSVMRGGSRKEAHANLLALVVLATMGVARSEAHAVPDSNEAQERTWNLHFQETTVTQWHYRFRSPYAGLNSLEPNNESQTSLTSTLFFGIRLWRDAELYINPEMSGGRGISGASGVAGFTNGETVRLGDATPTLYPARIYLTYSFGLGGEAENVEESANRIGGSLPRDRLTFCGGKFSLVDFFDDNSYSHDPRTRFLNWALMSNGAWDYAADTRGYTWGILGEYRRSQWALRVAVALEPAEANGLELDTRIRNAFSLNAEYERQFAVDSRKGVIRVLLFRNEARMGNYREATDNPSFHNDVTQTEMYGRTKYGLGLNAEQQVSDDAGLFIRASLNDGTNETWAFTEIDRSVSAGTVITGRSWNRINDQAGAAIAVNGISRDHADYLASGGYGFMLGDGALHYAAEVIVEGFYSAQIVPAIAVTFDYQFVAHPGYNSDRGPVHVFAVRVHTEI